MKKEDINKKDKPKKKKRSKLNRIIRRILLLILIVLIGFAIWFTCRVIENGGGLKGFLAAAVGHDKETLKNLDRINVLVMGESGVGDGYKLADTIMVVSYNPKNQQAGLLSIPKLFSKLQNKCSIQKWHKHSRNSTTSKKYVRNRPTILFNNGHRSGSKISRCNGRGNI